MAMHRWLVSGSARRDQAHAAAWRAHQDATEAWEKDREQIRMQTAKDARLAALQRGHSNSTADDRSREAALEAVRRFEREHPVPTFNGNATARTMADEEQHSARIAPASWLARAAEKIGVA